MNKVKSGFPIVCISLMPLLAFSQSTLVTEFSASKDNTLYSEADSSNGLGLNLFTGTTNTGNERRALIMFDLTSLTPEDTIVSASLQMFMSKTNQGEFEVSLHRLTRDWGEGSSDAIFEEGGGATPQPGDATWNFSFFDTDMWTTPGGDYDSIASAGEMVDDIGSYTWSGEDMLADVESWIESPASNFGWIMILESDGVSSKRFNSRHNAMNPPLLSLEVKSSQQPDIISEDVSENVILYPNPSPGMLMIKGDRGIGIEKIQVFTSAGREIETGSVIHNRLVNNGRYQVFLPEAGMYIVVINNSIRKKFIVY